MASKRWVVPMTRDTSQTVTIVVTAETPYQAEELAWLEARNNWELPWTDDEDCSKPYCPAPEDIEELEAGQPVSDGFYELHTE